MRPLVESKGAARLSLIHILVGLVLVCIGCSSMSYAEELSKFERERGRMMLKIVKDDLIRHYYDADYHGLQLEEAFGAAEQKIEQASSISQIFAAIARPLLQLDDSHTFFIPPGRSISVEFGWHMQMVGDRCYITAVQEGSDAEAKGLKRGDLVLSVDGHAPTRNNLWGMNYVFRILAPRASLVLVVQSPGAEQREIEVKAKVEQKKRFVRLTTGSDLENFIHEMEDRAYLGRHRLRGIREELLIWKMPEFDLTASEVKTNMKKAGKYKSLILDLRGNPGGAVETLEWFVGSFVEGKVKIGDVKSRDDLQPIVAKKAPEVYEGKVVVLVDSESGSAAELFARMMQLTGRGTVMGDRTSGSVMMSRGYDHMIGSDSGIFLATSITRADIIMTDGKSLEHVGVTPDELLLPSAEDLMGGRDPVMSRATELCGVAIEPEKAGAFFPIEWKR